MDEQGALLPIDAVLRMPKIKKVYFKVQKEKVGVVEI